MKNKVAKWFTLSLVTVTNQREILGEFGDFSTLPLLLAAWKKESEKFPEYHPLQWQVECNRRNDTRPDRGDECFKLLDLPSLKPLTMTMLMKRQVVVMEARYKALSFKALEHGVNEREQIEAKLLAKELGIKIKR